MHLEIACVATGKEEGPIVTAPTMHVLIDNSNTNVKCVESAVPVFSTMNALLEKILTLSPNPVVQLRC